MPDEAVKQGDGVDGTTSENMCRGRAGQSMQPCFRVTAATLVVADGGLGQVEGSRIRNSNSNSSSSGSDGRRSKGGGGSGSSSEGGAESKPQRTREEADQSRSESWTAMRLPCPVWTRRR